MWETLLCWVFGHKPQVQYKSTGQVPPGTLCARCWRIKTLDGWRRRRVGP